eukprot:2818083-Pleurochrysis_carterae.AAC.3
MIPSLDAQSAVMVECVQNHTPHVIVIDEIGRQQEVDAARTVKRHGVRMVASAHGGTPRDLIANPELNGLVGGLATVTVGDAMAQKRTRNSRRGVTKTVRERAGALAFVVIVEICRGEPYTWRVVHDVAAAVDAVLEGGKYTAQTRTRDPSTGRILGKLARH